MNRIVIKSILYHYYSRKIRLTKNKVKNKYHFKRFFIGFFFLMKQLFFRYYKKESQNFENFSILTSPHKHVKDSLRLFNNNFLYVGKGSIHKFIKINLSLNYIYLSIKISQKKNIPFIEVLSLIYELTALYYFLISLKKGTIIYSSNFIDRYIFILSKISVKNNFKIINIPHGRLMKFDFKLKYKVSKFITFNNEDICNFKKYAFADNFILKSKNIKNFNKFGKGGKGKIAYISSASYPKINLISIFKILMIKTKKLIIYPHPREGFVLYKILEYLNLIKIGKVKFDDFDIYFGRLSSLTIDLYKQNKKVFFLNLEKRDFDDFPENSKILTSLNDLDEFKKIL